MKMCLRFGFLVRLSLSVVGVLLVANCGKSSSGPDTTAVSPTLTSLYSNVFSQNCIVCHVPGGASNGSTLDFSSITTAYQTLLSAHVSGTSTAGACASVRIVTPSHPETSYLEAVLDASYAKANFVQTGCTPYAVHLQNTNLSSAELSALSAWISNGAANN